MVRTPVLGALPTAGGRLQGDLLTQTLQRFPRLRAYAGQVAYRSQPPKQGYYSESYPPGSEDSFAPKKFAVETYGNLNTPRDLAGELVSHYLARGVDPTLTRGYKQFVASLTPFQHSTLRGQYKWSQQHEGETRPFQAWANSSGLPAYYRGAAFGQWNQPKLFTRAQRAQLGKVLGYLRG